MRNGRALVAFLLRFRQNNGGFQELVKGLLWTNWTTIICFWTRTRISLTDCEIDKRGWEKGKDFDTGFSRLQNVKPRKMSSIMVEARGPNHR